MFRNFRVFFLFMMLFSCEKTKPLDASKSEFKIVIQPYSDVSDNSVNYVYENLKKITPNVKISKKIELPKSSFYPPRNRYRADSLIKFLAQNAQNDEVYLGITSKDISVKKNTENDLGVMGLGFRPGKACAISTFRLSNKNTDEQLFKVAIHELGHTQGLPHCSEKYCFMRDAEGKNPTNEEKEFCGNCKKFLSKKGWNLNSKSNSKRCF